ncbi:hypothetical protein BASA81_001199 [Batrachochytrium salamandrivorans]|nr:hypothetical protein BASA81_001199 [Batrachochytrium salamandrivorans]
MLGMPLPVNENECILEVVTPEWKYFDCDEYNFDESRIVCIKEQRKMGTQRGSKTTPQAPALEVRAKGLPPTQIACRARLWNFGPCSDGEPPRHDGTAQQLSLLRANVTIDVTENVAIFGPVQENGFRYARLRCFINRGARVQCRKFHTAFMLDCVYLPPGAPIPGPEESNFAVGPLVENFPWTRSSRMSISEKAMCPRINDRSKKSLGGGMDGNGDNDSESSSPLSSSNTKRLKKSPSTSNMMNSPDGSLRSLGGMETPSSSLLGVGSTGQRKDNNHSLLGSAGSSNQASSAPPSALHLSMSSLPLSSGGGGSSAAAQFFNFTSSASSNGGSSGVGGSNVPPMDRNIRLSTARFSIPGFDDDFFQHHVNASNMDDAEFGSVGGHGGESGVGPSGAALTSRRTSHFGPSQANWANFFLYPQVPSTTAVAAAAAAAASVATAQGGVAAAALPASSSVAAAAAAAAVANGSNNNNSVGTPASSVVAANTSSLFDNDEFRRNLDIHQRRLSPSAAQWPMSPPMSTFPADHNSDTPSVSTPSSTSKLPILLAHHSNSTGSAISSSSLKPLGGTLAGTGPEWDQMFATHTKLLEATEEEAKRSLKQELVRRCEAVVLLHGGSLS